MIHPEFEQTIVDRVLKITRIICDDFNGDASRKNLSTVFQRVRYNEHRNGAFNPNVSRLSIARVRCIAEEARVEARGMHA